MVPVVVLQLTSGAKARIAVAGLGLLFLWPFAHFRLVEEYRLDPWRFFGFAMYCRPTLPPGIDVTLVVDGRRVAYPEEQWPADGRQILEAFRRDRKVLGTLRAPNRVASWIFRTRPDADELVLVVRHPRIDRETGLLLEDELPYRYERPR